VIAFTIALRERQKSRHRALERSSCHLAKIDIALYFMRQANRGNRQRERCGQSLARLQPMFDDGLTHCILNLALSGDAELFEQLRAEPQLADTRLGRLAGPTLTTGSNEFE
jgi:hypothetical protein